LISGHSICVRKEFVEINGNDREIKFLSNCSTGEHYGRMWIMNRNVRAFISVIIIMACLCPSLMAQDAQFFIRQGLAFAQQKMWEKAVAMFQKAIALQPQNYEAHNYLGYVYAEAGYFKEALQEYEIALKIKPDYKSAQDNLISGVTSWSQDLIDHGQYSTAEEVLKSAIARCPGAGEFYYFLGIAYQAQDKFQEAMEQWQKAAKINPTSSTAHYVKAVEKFLARDVNGSIGEFNEAIKILPSNAFAHNMLGIIYAQTGKLDEAKKEFGAAIRYKPNYVEPYLNLAFLYQKEGKVEDAIKNFKTATVKNPYSVKGLMSMGSIYFETGRFFDAESCYNRALRVQPLSPRVHFELALTYARQNKHQDAIKEFERATSLNANYSEAHYALGLIFKGAKDDSSKQRAIEEFQKCIAIDPNGKYGQMAAQKIAEMGGNAAVPQATGTPASPAAPILCESPEGDVAITVTPEWQDVPIQGEGADKYLWKMARPDKGMVLTVYRPQHVPVNNLDTIKNYVVKEAEKKGAKKESETKVQLGGQEAYKVQVSDPGGNAEYLLIAVKNKKAYVFIVDMKDPGATADLEGVMNTIQIR
jgi:tetratricopeptide (TPR) repeat protein